MNLFTIILILSFVVLIGAILILRDAVNDAKEMPEEYDEYGLDSSIGDDVDRILLIQALKNKLDKVEEEYKKPMFKDYNDEDIDLSFMIGLS